MYEEILANIHTSDDLHVHINEIRKLKESLYKRNFQSAMPDKSEVGQDFNGGVDFFDSVLGSEVRAWVAKIIQEDLQKYPKGKEEYLNGLEEKLLNMREMRLTLSFEPNELTIKRISESIKKDFGIEVYVNFMYDKYLIGGVVITFNGKYVDYSLRKVFDNAFDEERDKIKKLMFG